MTASPSFLTPEEGQRLLGRFDDSARALVEEVGGLPLALEILRAYLADGPSAAPPTFSPRCERPEHYSFWNALPPKRRSDTLSVSRWSNAMARDSPSLI